MTSSAVSLKTKNFPFDFANQVKEDISQPCVLASITAITAGTISSKFFTLYYCSYDLILGKKLKKNNINHCKSNAVLTRELHIKADIRKKSNQFLIWVSFG